MASIEAWKAFINGRIALEKGDVESGLAAIKEAAQLDPTEPIFTRSREVAEGLVRTAPEEAATTTLAAEYNRMAKANSGDGDKPEIWLKDLQSLLDKAEGRVAVSAVAW